MEKIIHDIIMNFAIRCVFHPFCQNLLLHVAQTACF